MRSNYVLSSNSIINGFFRAARAAGTDVTLLDQQAIRALALKATLDPKIIEEHRIMVDSTRDLPDHIALVVAFHHGVGAGVFAASEFGCSISIGGLNG